MADPARRHGPGLSCAAIMLLGAVVTAPDAGAAGLDCKGVVTFADAMTRAVTVSLDLDRGTVRMPGCIRYAELHGFCHGDILRADEHHFRFGGVESRENTRLELALIRGDVSTHAGYVATGLRVVFLGRCAPAARRSAMRLR
jgi:hypothetical protein